MENLSLTLSVVVLFVLRIGIPVLLLIILGVLIDRWQTAREKQIRGRYQSDDQQRAAT